MGPAVIPLALTAVSAGAQYANQRQQQAQQNNAFVQDLQQQQQLQSQARGQVNRLTQQIAQDSPRQIAAQEEGAYVDALRRGAAGSMQGGGTSTPTTYGQPTSAVGATAGADPRFAKQLGADQQQVQNYGSTYADEMANMDAAVRQRRLEGLGMQTLQTSLDNLNAESYANNFVNELRAQAAQGNPWLALGGKMAGGAADYYAMQAPSTPASGVGITDPYAAAAYNQGVKDPAAARAAWLGY